MSAAKIYDLLERLATLLGAEERRVGKEWGLEAVHLRALRYLGRANRYSDTPIAVAEFLGLTKGTASQTLLRLQEKGLLASQPDREDGRKVHLSLTRKGRQVVSHVDPPILFRRALSAYTDRGLEASLVGLLRSLQRANESSTFGVCETCEHLLREPAGRFRCGLTQEPLRKADTNLLCRDHLSSETP